MNELLQKHGCSNIFTLPEGLKELVCDISREVLREQPANILNFISNYLSVLLITREHGVLAMKILDDLCDCKSSVSEHLMQLGMEREQADALAQVIKEEIEDFEPVEGKEKVKESQIIKKILKRSVLDELMTSKVCQVSRNAYKDYWYRKKLLEQSMKVKPDEPWEIAAQHTLEIYKKTKPSFSELARATEKIQAAYRGYHVRKKLLKHLKVKPKKMLPKSDMPGPPPDVAASREIDLGPVLDISIQEDDVNAMFIEYVGEVVGLKYDPMKTITHVEKQASKSASLSTQVQPSSVKVLTVMEVRSKQNLKDSKQKAQMSRSDARHQTVDVTRQPSVTPIPDSFVDQSLHKISFAEKPPKIISFDDDDAVEETASLKEATVEDHEVSEIQEEPGVVSAELVEGEVEVPEDITGDTTEADATSSVATASAPSTAPDTPDVTDTDEAGE